MGRILGVDLGSRRIGIALSDPGGVIASPLATIERSGDAERDRRAIVAMAVEHEARTVVVGLPREMSGRLGPAAKAARAEVLALEAMESGIEFALVDERLTTVIAERSMVGAGAKRGERRRKIDQVAAAVILQSYLASRA
ncbi:MAG: Holliday junction resolvase RuvX [Acidimicrobiia bacterium]|nr:Holliday junction resolvase RuvX [Acidimicrobiia bacterium]